MGLKVFAATYQNVKSHGREVSGRSFGFFGTYALAIVTEKEKRGGNSQRLIACKYKNRFQGTNHSSYVVVNMGGREWMEDPHYNIYF